MQNIDATLSSSKHTFGEFSRHQEELTRVQQTGPRGRSKARNRKHRQVKAEEIQTRDSGLINPTFTQSILFPKPNNRHRINLRRHHQSLNEISKIIKDFVISGHKMQYALKF